ncbi:TlpA disulfide reductase family protein [Sphingobacterium bovistauri]|uniref:Redoxin domain-containing protein n=1 Tax=Sphingobacterium bovistauri TaxID=2781959 RepID=A0ABS7Z8Z5_9SPHI|nr:TlpA disulfide reductase family protein [Sphingobacterium bovistauri]MCA5006660.1 redoxin domain-containing protein [Sphingobacterium bovistauri]
MKKTILSLAILGACISFQTANAQLAKKKGITLEEISKELNILSQKSDDNSKNQMLLEAKALTESKNESFAIFGSRIYTFLEKKDEAEKVDKAILKKFPKGIKARGLAFEKVFEEKNATALVAEKNYNEFLKKFPAAKFEEREQALYANAEARLAGLFFKENNSSKAQEYVNKLKTSKSFIQSGYGLIAELAKNNDYTNSLPLLEELIAKAKEDKKVGSTYLPAFYPTYAKALYENGRYEESIKISEEQLKTNRNAAVNSSVNLTLANAYTKVGRDLDAFLLLDKFIKNGRNKDVEEAIKPLFEKLNAGKSNFLAYTDKLDAEIKEVTAVKYKAEMIKKEAPNFSLVNMEGKTVSLADLKGKVVVLDFWATWCGPCVMSFPGMQAAVNKYKDDKDVEFLFINTWQNEKNYEEIVKKFISDKNYTFNVLFDEMKDKTKATTTAYGVQGIPHKVVIDKEGFIRFESSGGSADVQKVVNEMETKIELARKG